MRLFSKTDYLRSPWKNGGGETMQVAIAPPGGAIDDFDWRISLAAVTSDGAFSSFPGIDRTLCLVAGAGIDLCVDETSVSIRAPDGHHSFRGEAACFARLSGGPIVDLNIMTRRAVFTHRVVGVGEGSRLGGSGRGGCWFVAVRDSIATSGQQSAVLAAENALRMEPGEFTDLTEGAGWLIELLPA
ncbi:MAG TPA: HutD family protein [Kaistia sp.]|nr:HutD family protein [Kaistia sp.]